MLRIWFNRTYATHWHTIGLLRQNPDGEPVRIYGTHADPTSPVLSACDVAESEPDPSVEGDAYVDWALDFCARHGIDVFVPRLHADTIAAARAEFRAAGVALVACPPRAAALLADKVAAYEDARAAGLAVPPYRVVRTRDELLRAFGELTCEVGRLCLKPVRGAGGKGYRLLTSTRPALADITGELEPSVHVDDVAAALDAHAASGEVVQPLMVLPYLPGPEVSVDCLGDEDGTLLAAVPRTKLGHERLLRDDPRAVDVARTLVARHRLSSLSNTQVRYWAHPGRDATPLPYLLETNTRMSGGLHQTALSGLNLPWAGVLQALGRPVRLPEPRYGTSCRTILSLVPARDAVAAD